MGFRDVESFNYSLLAKQGWRLFKQPQSLVAQVLKAKYHKNTSFLDAKIGRNPSYVWRSICEGQQLLKMGLRWRVGNGKNINPWEDA